MSEKERMTREIHEFVHGNMDWEEALLLITSIAQSAEWIDYLLKEIESLECTVTPHPHFHIFAILPNL